MDINQNAIGIVKEKLRLLGPQEMIASYRTLIGDLEKERFSLNNNHRYGLVKIDKAIKDYTDTIEKIKVKDDGLIKTLHQAAVADARSLKWDSESFDAIITDIPYGDMIRYSDQQDDLSALENYDDFLTEINKAFEEMWRVLKKGKYLVIFVADNRIGASRRIVPIHADVINYFRNKKMHLFDLLIWRYLQKWRISSFR